MQIWIISCRHNASVEQNVDSADKAQTNQIYRQSFLANISLSYKIFRVGLNSSRLILKLIHSFFTKIQIVYKRTLIFAGEKVD